MKQNVILKDARLITYSKVNAFLQISIFRFFAQRNHYTAHSVG